MKPRMDTLLMDLPERKFGLRTRNAISAHLGLPSTELQVRHAVGLSVYDLAKMKNMGEKGVDQVWALACSVEFESLGPEAMESVYRGLEQARRGETHYLGSFADYL